MDNIFQSKEWEEFKLQTGYHKSHRVEGILILQKSLPFGRTMLYSPMVAGEAAGILKMDFLNKIKVIGQENSSIFYRLELDIPLAPDKTDNNPYVKLGFAKAFEEMQPEHTWILDITKSEEELLKEMSVRCRYNVRHAEKEGVVITAGAEDGLDNFYNLYSTTGKRHGITFRGKNYFATLLEIMSKDGYAQIYVGAKEIEGKKVPLTAGILIFTGEKAIYMFGASSNEYRNIKAPNLLVWQMIKAAKERGCKEFDFFGIAPTDDPKHPWAGITSFKKQFNGIQRDILGSYDLILKPAEYQLFKLAEKIRR